MSDEASQSRDASKEPIRADQVLWHCRTCGSLDTQAWKRPPSHEVERLRAALDDVKANLQRIFENDEPHEIDRLLEVVSAALARAKETT